MTLDEAIYRATLHCGLIGIKVVSKKKQKIKTVTRVTAYRKDNNSWDVAIFFTKKIWRNTGTPNCFLQEFVRKYDIHTE